MSNGRKTVLLIAGEASGDTLGAELIKAMRDELGGEEIDFIGAGGPQMEAAALRPEFDLSEHAVVGIWEVLKNYFKFRRLFRHLLELATRREPDIIVLIDYPGFNLRFAKAIRRYNAEGGGAFREWQPKIICYVSPQLWAWKEGRVHQIANDIDLMLSIFPFEKDWYAERVPGFPVEFVGHPLVDRFPLSKPGEKSVPLDPDLFTEQPTVLLLPGSRRREVDKHLPVMLEAAVIFSEKIKTRLRMVLPNREMHELAKRHIPTGTEIDMQIGGLAERAWPGEPSDRLLRHGHDGVRLVPGAHSRAIQDQPADLLTWPNIPESALPRHAQSARRRGTLSRVPSVGGQRRQPRQGKPAPAAGQGRTHPHPRRTQPRRSQTRPKRSRYSSRPSRSLAP